MRQACCFLILLSGISFFALPGAAQTCTGSLGAPVINETFGAGKEYDGGPRITNGSTDLDYVYGPSCGGEDGTYGLLQQISTSCKGGTWQSLGQDHTGDKFGYMMVINASLQPSVFFTYKIDGSKLCPNTTYQFAAWIMNLVRPIPSTAGFVLPNITFSIEKSDGTVLKTYNTGDVPEIDQPTWINYGTMFISPPDGSDLVVKMKNNGSGGDGNDLALDDITVSPCGPVIQAGFGTIGDNADRNSCQADNLNYTLVARQTGYNNPGYIWQQNKNDGSGWVTIPGETTTTLKITINNAAAGKYQYRIGVLNGVQAGAENCRIYSDPLNINVYPPPKVVLSSATSGCTGFLLQLSSTGGDFYQWTGPNNFSSAEDSPVISYNASPVDNGVYNVRVMRNNCPTFAATTVTVYSPATIDAPMMPATICEGDNTQLNVSTTNATRFKWMPADGLDHDDIANPVATPAVTTTYTVTAYNDGCDYIEPTASVVITVLKKPFANAGNTVKLMEGQSAKLNGTVEGDNIKVYWTPADNLDDPSSATPVTSATSNITYTLHVESLSGCGLSTSSVFVRVYKKLGIVNSFSPNGDGVNEYWNIKNIETYPKSQVSIFNRYGQRVFQSNGYSKPWNGTSDDSKLPVGVYYYIIDLKEDGLPAQSGWIYLVR